jgi:hypothetical protein
VPTFAGSAAVPGENGNVERFIRTLQTEWACRHVFINNDERSATLAPWLDTTLVQALRVIESLRL